MADRTRLDALQREAAQAAAAVARFPRLVEEYLKLSGVPQSRFGTETGAAADFIRLLRLNRDFRASTMQKVLDHIATTTI